MPVIQALRRSGRKGQVIASNTFPERQRVPFGDRTENAHDLSMTGRFDTLHELEG